MNDVLVAGITLGAYLVGRLVNSPKCPPVGLAVVIGGVAVYFFGQTEMQQLVIELPTPTIPDMAFSLGAFLGVSLPMVIFAMGLGNVQGIGFLMAQDYKVPTNVVTISVGFGSILNSLFGGHAASVARSTAGIVASSSAGPHEKRYWANLIAAGLALTIALSAASVASLLTALPRSFVVTLAGLAILSAMQDSLQRAFSGSCRFGALVAFAVAATPFKILGIPSSFWAILLGVIASLMAERAELFAQWGQKKKD